MANNLKNHVQVWAAAAPRIVRWASVDLWAPAENARPARMLDWSIFDSIFYGFSVFGMALISSHPLAFIYLPGNNSSLFV